MIKLFSLKQQRKDEEGSSRPGGSQKKASAAQLRITKGKKKNANSHITSEYSRNFNIKYRSVNGDSNLSSVILFLRCLLYTYSTISVILLSKKVFLNMYICFYIKKI